MKKKVLRQPKVYEAKRSFTTASGGGGYVMSGNPLASGGGG